LDLLIPVYAKSPKAGRPRLRMRNVVGGIFYVLATGFQWKAMPKQFGSGSAIHIYFQEWTKLGVFQELARHGLTRRPQIHADMPETFFDQLKVPFTAQKAGIQSCRRWPPLSRGDEFGMAWGISLPARFDQLKVQMRLHRRPFAGDDAVDAGVAQRAVGRNLMVAKDAILFGT